MLREQHVFLVATSLMRKQTCVTIATRDYQRCIHSYFILNYEIIILFIIENISLLNYHNNHMPWLRDVIACDSQHLNEVYHE